MFQVAIGVDPIDPGVDLVVLAWAFSGKGGVDPNGVYTCFEVFPAHLLVVTYRRKLS